MPSEKASDGISWRKQIKPIYCYRQFIHNTHFQSSIFLHTEYINTRKTQKAASIVLLCCLISQTALPPAQPVLSQTNRFTMIKNPNTLNLPIFRFTPYFDNRLQQTPDKSARWENISTISNDNIHTYINKDSVRKNGNLMIFQDKKLLPI